MVVKIERKRYLLIEFDGEVPEDRYLIRELRKKVALLGGQLALASSSLHVIDIIGNYGIIRSTHTSRDIVEAAIQLLQLQNTTIVVRTVSGTIAKINRILDTQLEDPDEDTVEIEEIDEEE